MLDAQKVLTDNPWVMKRGINCLLSPDSDGFICGLLATTLLGWRVVGFYDGKVMAIRKDLQPSDCAFLDIEINRPVVGSIGHHMLTYNNRLKPVRNFNFQSCIQPNEIRMFAGNKSFQSKYPFGTAHLLLTLYQSGGLIKTLEESAIIPLLFTDGVWNNLAGYTENCLDWIRWLQADSDGHILEKLFYHHTSLHNLMQRMDAFMRIRDSYNAKGTFIDGEYSIGGRVLRTGDKLRISNPSGQPINLAGEFNDAAVHPLERKRIEAFYGAVGDMIGCPYNSKQWDWESLSVRVFEKGILDKVNNQKYQALFAQNPVSLAMTSGAQIEYTIDPNIHF